MPAAARVPRIQSVHDGINLLSGNRIVDRPVKVAMTDVERSLRIPSAVDETPLPTSTRSAPTRWISATSSTSACRRASGPGRTSCGSAWQAAFRSRSRSRWSDWAASRLPARGRHRLTLAGRRGARRRCIGLPAPLQSSPTAAGRRGAALGDARGPGYRRSRRARRAPCCAWPPISPAGPDRRARRRRQSARFHYRRQPRRRLKPPGLPGYDHAVLQVHPRQRHPGAEDVPGLTVERVPLREIAGFAVLVNRSRRRQHRPGATSRRTADRTMPLAAITPPAASCWKKAPPTFASIRCRLRSIRGNGIWTHSLYTSPRNGDGRIGEISFTRSGRDAIQVGHAYSVRVERTPATRIGFPSKTWTSRAAPSPWPSTPPAMWSAVRLRAQPLRRDQRQMHRPRRISRWRSVAEIPASTARRAEAYRFGNYGIVMNNTNPDMRSHNIRVIGNVIDGPMFGGDLRDRNWAPGGAQPAAAREHGALQRRRRALWLLLRPGRAGDAGSGIYLGRGAERPAPARGNTIADNEISGFKMDTRCIGRAPGIGKDWNIVRGNVCRF